MSDIETEENEYINFLRVNLEGYDSDLDSDYIYSSDDDDSSDSEYTSDEDVEDALDWLITDSLLYLSYQNYNNPYNLRSKVRI
jgi:hypothetical protein